MSHRYKVGQLLDLRSAPGRSNRPAGTCEVIACLPHDRGPVLYRIKSRNEANERVVDEVDLGPSGMVKTLLERGEDVFDIAIRKR